MIKRPTNTKKLFKPTYYCETIYAKERDGRQVWELIKEFINSIENNKTFTRKEMFAYVYEAPDKWGDYPGTLDSYRNKLTKLGFLKIVDKGVYKKLYNVPPIPVNAINRLLKDKSWKSWMMTIGDRLKDDGHNVENMELPDFVKD